MIFWSTSRKRLGGRGASRTFGTRAFVALVLLSLALVPVMAAHAEQWQKLDAHGYINDFGGVLDTATAEELMRLCGEVDQKAKAQIAVVTIKSLEGDSAEDFANHLFQKWGVGYKGTDRDVMVLLAVDDHKYWTEVGYGLEPILPDGKVGGFGRDMVPVLRRGDYNHAAAQIVSQIAAVIAQASHVSLDSLPQSPAAPPPSDQSEGQESHVTTGEIVGFLVLLVLVGILFMVFGPWLLFSLFLGGGGRGDPANGVGAGLAAAEGSAEVPPAGVEPAEAGEQSLKACLGSNEHERRSATGRARYKIGAADGNQPAFR